jgi:hypothetical protein
MPGLLPVCRYGERVVVVSAIAAHRTQIPPDWSLINVPDAYKPTLLGHEALVELDPVTSGDGAE